MEDSLGKIISIFLALLLIIIFPVLSFGQLQDEASRTIVFSKTTQFVDSVRSLGYITPEMYENLRANISRTGLYYDIKMEHYHKTVMPMLERSGNSYVVKPSTYHSYDNIITNEEIMDTLFPHNPSQQKNYYLSKEDYFVLSVHNVTPSIATKIAQIIVSKRIHDTQIIVRYGGMIKDETQ